jgi:pimeloyl-ACP methyl ester carboxylesterase
MRRSQLGFSHTVVIFSALCLGVGFSVCANDISGSPVVNAEYVDVPGGQLFYEAVGEGQPFVMIHDGLLHRETWDNQFAEFSRYYRVIRYDRRGYGKSPAPEGPYSNEDDLLRVLDHFGLKQAVLMGMSSGGGLAIDFALAHPDRVKSLILVGAVVSGFGYSDHFLSRGGRLTREMYADPDRLWRYLVEEDPWEIAPENAEAKKRAAELMEANPWNADHEKHRLRNRPERYALDALGEILVPTLVVIGEHDIPDVHAHGGAIEAGIPNAERVIVAGAGHLVPLEQPDRFNTTVLDFLGGQWFFGLLDSEGVAEAVRAFHRLRRERPEGVPFAEGRMNGLGYQYLRDGDYEGAVELFKLNTLAYPESWNVWDSLGEGYVKIGDKDRAVESYEKSLELNPDNENGMWQLRWMEGLIYAAQHETREELQHAPGEQTGVKGPYFGQKPPGRVPKVFAPGIVSSRGGFEFCASFTPDGREFYLNRGPDICVSRLEEEGWTAPEPASFNAPDLDHEAHVTADGQKLFFGTRRTPPGQDTPDYGIWFMERAGEGWGEPQYHGPGMYVTTSRNRNLYVTDTSVEPSVIVMQEWADGEYAPPVRLEGGVNSGHGDAHPCIAPDESFIIFDSRRPGSLGGEWDDDLYVSFRNPDGTWGEAIHLGRDINTPGNNMTASLSPDGKYLFYFSSDDIYWVDAAVIESFRP